MPIWLDAMGIDEDAEDNDEEFYNSLSEMLMLINSCEQIVKRSDRMNQDLHIKQLGRVKKAILRASARTWGEFRGQFNDDFMLSLRWAAEDMSNHWDEEVISAEHLTVLQADVEEVINQVVDSALDDELKRVLFDGLESVRQSLLNYQMFGVEGIRNAVDRNIGSYARHREDFDVASENESKEVINAYKKFINKVNVVSSTALKFKQLAKPIVQILPMLGVEADDCP